MSTTDATTTDLATIERRDIEVSLSSRDLELIRRQVNIPKGARPPSDRELDDFGRYCMAQRLNPFDRQIYLANIGGRWIPFTGVHGRLVIALRTHEVDGMEGPYYCHKREGLDRERPPDWDELWSDPEPPHAAKFIVYRKGWTHHPVGVAPWRYYNKGVGTWTTNPPLMLGYKAITRALNLVFPDVMPPAPDTTDDDTDIDESTGYVRTDVEGSEPTPPHVSASSPPRGPMVDARGLAEEFNMTASAVLVGLRRLATVMSIPPPTALDAVDAELVDVWRDDQASDEEPF